MARKRPSINEIANVVGGIGRANEALAEDESGSRPSPPPDDGSSETVEPEKYWRKFTVPYRQEQLARLDQILARWAADKRIKISTAEVVRLALDEMIERMEQNPDDVLLLLHQQEQREQADVPTRKYSRSRGVARYLKHKSLV